MEKCSSCKFCKDSKTLYLDKEDCDEDEYEEFELPDEFEDYPNYCEKSVEIITHHHSEFENGFLLISDPEKFGCIDHEDK